ncbi:TPA: hypothetical protein ACH3X3_003837 [Trebouxia sp. C0006]
MASRSGYLLKHSVKQVEYGKLVDLLFHSHSSTTSNTAGNDIDTPHSFGDTPCGKRTSHRRAEAAKLSGVSHSNVMHSQSRLPEVHTQQSTGNKQILSKMMASGLVASCSVLALGFTNLYQ